jgi:hypothetical protein
VTVSGNSFKKNTIAFLVHGILMMDAKLLPEDG